MTSLTEKATPLHVLLRGVDVTMQPRGPDQEPDAASSSSRGVVLLRMLPNELLLTVLSLVVGTSVSTLARLALVCRKWYVTSQDPLFWKRFCIAEWPDDFDPSYKVRFFRGASWKAMFTDRPQLRTDGAYICKVEYLRPGESDSYYQPIHVVTYYRYLRFMPDNTVYSLMTSEEPGDVVHHLRRDNSSNQSSNQGLAKLLMVGTYTTSEHLDDPRPYLAVKVALRGPAETSLARFTYVMDLQLRSTEPCASNKLSWAKYISFDHTALTAELQGELSDWLSDHHVTSHVPGHDRTVYDLTKHKAFIFSKVRSYANSSSITVT